MTISVTSKSRTISNGDSGDATPVEQNFVDLYANDATLVSEINNIAESAYTFTGVKTFSSTPKTDALAEKTADGGVTIDSVRCKDGMVMVSGTPASGGEIGYASNRLKYHNGTSVITLPDIDGVASVSVISADPTAGASDRGKFYVCTGTFTFSIAAASSLNVGWYCWIRNEGTGVVTIDPNSTETIDLQTTMALYPGETIMVIRIGSSTFRTMFRRKGWLPLATATASSSTSVDFTSFINSDFDEYELHYHDVMPATDNVALWLRITKDGGTNWRSTAGDYTWSNLYINTTTGSGNNSSDSEIELNRNVGNASNEGCSGVIRFFNPSGTSRHKWFIYDGTHVDNSGLPERSMGRGAYILDNNAINGVRLLFSSGNIASGTFKLLGWRQ